MLRHDEILELKEICFQKKEYPVAEVRTLLRMMADEMAISSCFKVGQMKGWRQKKTLTSSEVFRLVYICLEMTHDISLQTDAERVVWMITDLENGYL